MTLFRKSVHQEDGRLMSQRITPLQSESRLLFYKEGGEWVVNCCKLLGTEIVCSCRCPQRSGQDISVNHQPRYMWYFREKLKQRLWRKSLLQERPIGSCSVTLPRVSIMSINNRKHFSAEWKEMCVDKRERKGNSVPGIKNSIGTFPSICLTNNINPIESTL